MSSSARLMLSGIAMAAGLAAGQGPALAEAAPPAPAPLFIGEHELAPLFAGKTIDGYYADGTTFTETYEGDGRIRYIERNRNMVGRWLVRAGTFCTIYDTSPTGGCYRVTRRGANCFEFYFVARDEGQAEREPGRPSWTAQAWIKGPIATCKDEPIV